MGVHTYRTKRFLYTILKDKLPGRKGCFAVTGGKKVGKTTLLHQLYETFKNESVYYNLINEKEDEYSIRSIYESAYKDGKKYVFLDEVCKLDYYDTVDFVQDTAKYASAFAIIMTGNAKSEVDKLFEDIDLQVEEECWCYELPPIMYAEKLCWDNGIEEVSLHDLKNLTSPIRYADYLRNENSDGQPIKMRYIKSVVSDAVNSGIKDDLSNPERLTKGLINKILKYVSLAQHIYKKEDGSYIYPHGLGFDAGNLLYKEYEGYKDKWGITNKDIDCLTTILCRCHLARSRPHTYLNGLLSVESKKLADRAIYPMIFEYPWMACFYHSISEDMEDNSTLENLWVKYSLLQKCGYIYHFCDNDLLEGIDIIYQIEDDIYGLGVKNGPHSENDTEYIQKTENLSNAIGLKDYLLTSTDRLETRIDIIALSLELEYMDMIREDCFVCPLSIPELVHKYFH